MTTATRFMRPYCIIVENIRPPIPSVTWDWCAYVDGHEENRRLYGYGPTRQDAVDELMEAIEDEVYENAQ